MTLLVAGVLAALILTAVLPPLVADESDRAIVNAPVTLLTAPISGDVKSLTSVAGQKLAANEGIGEIVNPRVDRSTLISLEGQLSDSGERLQATRGKIETNNRYIATIGNVIEQQKSAVISRYLAQIAELEAQVGSADAATREKQQIVTRQNTMVARSIAAPEMVTLANQQLASAQFQRHGMEARLEGKRAELASARNNIFVGDDVQQLASLVLKKRDMELESQKLTIEETETSAVMQQRMKLAVSERKRLDSLERSTVNAPAPGEVLFVNASIDRHVTAGDTLARLVDCNASFAVGIFSYRQGVNFAPGTRVSVSRSGQKAIGGTVTAVLPKTSDKVDEDYALPFPQTERRELYVLVKPDEPFLQTVAAAPAQRQGARCAVGSWVTIERESGWTPSTSILFTRIKSALNFAAARTSDSLDIRPAYAAKETAVESTPYRSPRKTNGPYGDLGNDQRELPKQSTSGAVSR
jgi:hypothetical protein